MNMKKPASHEMIGHLEKLHEVLFTLSADANEHAAAMSLLPGVTQCWIALRHLAEAEILSNAAGAVVPAETAHRAYLACDMAATAALVTAKVVFFVLADDRLEEVNRFLVENELYALAGQSFRLSLDALAACLGRPAGDRPTGLAPKPAEK